MANETLTQRAPTLPRTQARPWTFLLLVLGLAVVYVYGWKVTQINLGELVTKAHLVRPLVRDLIRPDLMTWRPRTLAVSVPFSFTRAGAPAPVPAPPVGPRLRLSSSVASPGQPLVVRGEGFTPNRPGVLIWQDQSGASAKAKEFRTDGRGTFTVDLAVPSLIGEHHHLIAEVTLEGRLLRPSTALTLVFGRLVETVFLALMGTTIAVILAVPLSFLGAKNLMARSPVGTTVYYIVRTVFNITRSIEPLIMATVFAVWVGIGPFAGVLALALHSVASLGKLYSEQIESIDPGPIEAITATGASPLQVVRYAVVPQIVPPFIAFTIYRWDINVRMSTVIGMVGGGGVGFLLIQFINLLQWQQAATAVWGITLIVAAMDYFSAKVREKVV
ncbi:MAG: phosphonate ABC transporter, permease protein PhnE [Armatimonadetes bacterium]|nr:phosphonate ABC transporter, permease protein PhnE [Armatimonadota bacterium]